MIFWALVGVFLIILGQFFIPAFREFVGVSELFLVPFLVFFLLGMALIFFTRREKIGNLLKSFLLLAGISATGFFVSILLHNIFYALGVLSGHIAILKYLADFLSIIFFFLAILVCPLAFLTGTIGVIILNIKRKLLKI